jgi:nucleotide-binding universal stress UspA family protein
MDTSSQYAGSQDASRQADGPVVVGVDPSSCARDATVWAADLAAAWGVPLHLVHVVTQRSVLTEVPPWLGELQDAARRAGAEAPRVDILWGVPADLLAGRTAGARMLVLGSYGEGASSGMLAGSLALALLDRAACPVAVIRGSEPRVPPPGSGPVVVGVDGSPAGRAALTFAAGLAGSWAAPLVVVHAWADVVAGIHGGARRTEAPATLAAEAGALLAAELDAVAGSRPDLQVQREVVGDTPVRALLARADDARVLVVGHRGDSGSGMLHGSTSRTLVEFAPCPVVVISPAAMPATEASTTGGTGSVR